MSVSELIQKLKGALKAYISHSIEKEWLNRTRKLGVKNIPRDMIDVYTDFSAQMDLEPNKKDNCHVNTHATLAVYYVITNQRLVELKSGDLIEYVNTEVWYAIGGTQEKGKKNDVVFHKAVLDHILRHYTSKDPLLKKVRVWTDNCAGQYKCRQNFFYVSKLPYVHENIEEAEHCFAQVYGFKGPWDAAGKVVKSKIRNLEREQKNRVPDAFTVYKLISNYFDEKLPNGLNWENLVKEGSEALRKKTEFTAVKRMACFVTDDEDEFDKLKLEGYDNIIFTNRSESGRYEDTTVYDGTSKIHHVFTGAVQNRKQIPERGYKLCLRKYPCFCSKCRNNEESACHYKHITGEVERFNKFSKDDFKNMKKKAQEIQYANITKKAKTIAERYTKESFEKEASMDEIKVVLKFIGVKATRILTNEEKMSGKTLQPRKADKLRAIDWPTLLEKIKTK